MRVHYIPLDADREIAYFPDTKRYFVINEKGKAMIANIQCRKTFEEIGQIYGISKEQFEKYVASIDRLSANSADIESVDKSISSIIASKKLNRLVINLSNDCNLRCRYCYANGGVYASDPCLLSTEVLDAILNVFFTEFNEISLIQFFGGEPLINIDALEYACKRIREIDGTKGTRTQLGLVTNGTLISDRFIALVKQYNLRVTVSYDGDPFVNDLLRMYPDGHGATETILKKAKWLKEETGEPSTIEVTYTNLHLQHGVSILDVIRHITELFPGTTVHLVPVGGKAGEDYTIRDLSVFADSIKEISNDYKHHPQTQRLSYTLADRVFSGLLQKDEDLNRFICDAGFGTLSVSVKGDVYPCFIFTDNSSLKMGNVLEPGLFQSEKYKQITNKFFEFADKFSNPKCKNCFINTICNGCIGISGLLSGDPFVLSDNLCNMFRRMTEEMIIDLAKVYIGKKHQETLDV